MDTNVINVGDYVIVQRQNYTKLHKMKKQSRLILGSFTIEMNNVIGKQYFDFFQIKNMPDNKLFTLEKVDEIQSIAGLNIETSGIDNRHIPNNTDSQYLTREDIDKLKEKLNSNNIVEQLINNSKTFHLKTGYSQEKYMKKKEKKYFEYVHIRKPTIRILTQMFYRQDPAKTLGIRVDDLSQILTFANIHQNGNHLLFDGGSSGVMPAAIMNTIGSKTNGKLIHMHPGNECQKNAFVAMQFPQEQSQRCINVNIYSVLRHYYQTHCVKNTLIVEAMEKEDNNYEPSTKKVKVEECTVEKTWEVENQKACDILSSKVDSLIVVAKEHPVNIVKELIPFLHGNRNIVVFSLLKEPLLDLYFYLKTRTDIVFIKLTNTFMRNYQILPYRTHPEVNMNMGGYILTGIKLHC